MTGPREEIEEILDRLRVARGALRDQMVDTLEELVVAERRVGEARLREAQGYNVLTDEAVEFPKAAPAIGSSQLRMRAIETAVSAVQAGAVFDVVKAAERYVAFALGQEVPAEVDARPFRERLRDLMEFEILRESTDLEKLRHDVAEVFGMVEDAHWPKVNMALADGVEDPAKGLRAADGDEYGRDTVAQ